MALAAPLLDTRLDGRAPDARGKVRDIYDLSGTDLSGTALSGIALSGTAPGARALGDTLLIVATDRISAFDYVLGSGIPDKGRVLTQLSGFWFAQTAHLVANHLLTLDVPKQMRKHADLLEGRSMLVRKTRPVPIECVARGYLSGSSWKEYTATGSVCGVALPPGLRESERLPEPIFTPATKAETGHDVNISEADAGRLIGAALVTRLRELTLALYDFGARHAGSRGIILADTKFEFGFLPDGTLLLIDEVMTPDSSRYWPRAGYAPGGPPPSFDKQYVRDYLEQIRWNKQPPVPALPEDVVLRTRDKYLEAFSRLTGRDLP